MAVNGTKIFLVGGSTRKSGARKVNSFSFCGSPRPVQKFPAPLGAKVSPTQTGRPFVGEKGGKARGF